MATQREKRLARAIENLSGRDLHNLVESIAGRDFSSSLRRTIQNNLLAYAQENYYDNEAQVLAGQQNT